MVYLTVTLNFVQSKFKTMILNKEKHVKYLCYNLLYLAVSISSHKYAAQNNKKAYNFYVTMFSRVHLKFWETTSHA